MFAVPVRVQPIVFVSFLLLLGCGSPGPQSPTATTRPAGGADRQIRWQRTLEDALAISAAEGRPILIAVNADGESASERIVRERYRDPEFVALTRPFVCLIASPHRHSPRDYEWDGSRMPCPRFGEVTCGEHQAVEPVVFDRFLGGERISPRHALVLPSGEKAFDLSLQWDLHEIDRYLADAAAKAPPPALPDPPPFTWRDSPKDPGERQAQWLALARGRTHRERLRFESTLADFLKQRFTFREGPAEVLPALEREGDGGSIGAIRILLSEARRESDELCDRLIDLGTALGLGADMTAALWDMLTDPRRWPGGPLAESSARPLLRALARVDGRSARTRSLLLSYLVASYSEDRPASEQAALELLGEEECRRATAAVEAEGGPLNLSLLDWAAWLSDPVAAPPPPPLPAEEAAERELAEAEEELRSHPEDPDLLQRVGRASLVLARRRIESGKPADLHLADAERFLAGSSEREPRDSSLLLDRARVAYHLGKFEDEERLATETLSHLGGLSFDPWARVGEIRRKWVEDDHDASGSRALTEAKRALSELTSDLGSPAGRLEAFRWLGDGAARLLASRSGREPETEVRGMARGLRALALAALARGSDATDWLSLASWFGALGRRPDEAWFARRGTLQFPDSAALHDALGRAIRDRGRIAAAVSEAASVAGNPPRSATAVWYLGLAHFLAAEWGRRGEVPDQTIQSYRDAEVAFEKSAEMRPDFADSANHYLAMAALGRGFAHLIADQRKEAADCLLEGLSIRPAFDGVRDGLDREAVDLLDGALEWRESGPSPVDPVELAGRWAKALPGNAAWIRRVADSELREALRADGRGAPGEGDAYLRRSIEVARRSLEIDGGEESRRTLAQSATIMAERLLHRGEAEAARPFLAEAAPVASEEAPAADTPAETLAALAAKLREKLGPARPTFRPGR